MAVDGARTESPNYQRLVTPLEGGKLEVAALFGRWAAEADPGNLQLRHNLGTSLLWSGREREARDLGAQLVGDAQPL